MLHVINLYGDVCQLFLNKTGEKWARDAKENHSLKKFKTPQLRPSRYLSREQQNMNLKRYMHLYVHCSIFYNSQDMEST